ncbi:hypothetical protein Ctob_011189, partial [Chrysochromulina tobinii]
MLKQMLEKADAPLDAPAHGPTAPSFAGTLAGELEEMVSALATDLRMETTRRMQLEQEITRLELTVEISRDLDAGGAAPAPSLRRSSFFAATPPVATPMPPLATPVPPLASPVPPVASPVPSSEAERQKRRRTFTFGPGSLGVTFKDAGGFVIINQVTAGSQAAKQGVAAGSKLISVSGKPMEGVISAAAVARVKEEMQRAAEQPMTMELESSAYDDPLGSPAWVDTPYHFTTEKALPAAATPATPAASPVPPMASPAPPEAAATGLGSLGPAWTRGELERPAGEKDMGGWKAAVYTEEQQARLGIDAEGKSVPKPAATPAPPEAGPAPTVAPETPEHAAMPADADLLASMLEGQDRDDDADWAEAVRAAASHVATLKAEKPALK